MNNGLREMLEQLPTTQLDEMLQAELQKRPPDPEAVKMIMRILEEREEPVELKPEIQAAWKGFKKSEKSSNNRRSWMGPLLRVASVILILALLFVAMPQEADAKSLWDRFLYVTDSIFEFLNPSNINDQHVGYEFKTDHPGLQQVYDVVVEMGVTEPVVPTWLPDGYELVEIKKENTKTNTKVFARFTWLDSSIVYQVDICSEIVTRDFFKDDASTVIYEKSGITHNVLRNNNRLVAIWNRDNIECFLTIESQEDTLYEVLNSIYVMRDDD